ncbi:MAG: hypothetical protein PVI66_06015 [Candidatus Aminicenantes bacterium]|jgi:hypothetical protein
MEKLGKKKVNAVIICSVLMLMVFSPLAFSMGDDLAKKYGPIVGTYEFQMDADVMTVKFWVEEEKFWGAPEGETPAEIVPMEGEEWKFEATTDDGQYFIISFVKDESGKFNKCILESMGMEIEGTRIEE